MINYSLWKVSILFIVILYSCNAEDFCLSNQHAVQTGLYSYNSVPNDKDTTLTDVSIYGVGKTDSIYESVSLQKAFLPLSFLNDTTQFVIFLTQLKSDTIKFVYRKELNFISGDCGYIFDFHLDTVLFSSSAYRIIDSVSIAYSEVKYGEDIENVKIYIHY